MKSGITIGRRFVLTAGALMLLVAIMALIAIRGFHEIDKQVRSMADDSLPGLVYATSMTHDIDETRVWQLRYQLSNDSESLGQAQQRLKTTREQLTQDMKGYEANLTQDEDRRNFEKLKSAVGTIDTVWPAVVRLRYGNKRAESEKLYSDALRPVMLSMASLLPDMSAKNKRNADGSMAEIAGTLKAGSSFTVTFAILAFVAGVGIAWFMIVTLNRQMGQVVSELSEGADQIAGAASQVASSSQMLAQGSSQQAASIEETSASSEEINSMARKNTDNSRSMASLMSQSQTMFVKTNTQLNEMIVSMDEINQSSGKISKIIKVIDEIAFQTNILALNAAVEAARAGEAGMGFAVVADEVRSLAQRSAQAAKDTALLIEESISKSNAGKERVDHVAATIQTITSDSAKIKTLVDEVSLGSEEQSRGLEQIARAISQMEQVTQATAANAEESAAAAEELNAQSETLRDVVHRLNAMLGGSQRMEIARRPSAVRPGSRNAPVKAVRAASSLAVATRTKVAAKEKDEFPLEAAFHEF